MVDSFQMALLRGLQKVKQEVPSGADQVDQLGTQGEGHRGWREGRRVLQGWAGMKPWQDGGLFFPEGCAEP